MPMMSSFIFVYRITPHTTRTFIHCSTYVKEGVRVIDGYINQNIFTSMLWHGRVGHGGKYVGGFLLSIGLSP